MLHLEYLGKINLSLKLYTTNQIYRFTKSPKSPKFHEANMLSTLIRPNGFNYYFHYVLNKEGYLSHHDMYRVSVSDLKN